MSSHPRIPTLEVTPVEPPPTRRPQDLPGWMTPASINWRQASAEELSDYLENVKLQDLRRLARARGWKTKGTRKAQVVSQIQAHLTDPEAARQALQDLDPEHQQVLRAMVLLGDAPNVQLEDIERVATLWGSLNGAHEIVTYTHHLCQVGLALAGETRDAYYAHADFVPHAIACALPPLLTGHDLPPTAIPERAAADQRHLGDPFALVRTTGQILLLLEQSAPPLRPPMPRPKLERYTPGLKKWDYVPKELALAQAQGNLAYQPKIALTVPPPRYALPDETIARLAPIAGGPARLEFIYTLLLTAGVIQPGSPVTVWPEVKVHFLWRDELAQRALLARMFFYTLNWSALWEVLRAQPTLTLKRIPRHQYLKPTDLNGQLMAFRHLVLRVLATLPDGQWVAISDLERVLRAVWPRFDEGAWQIYHHASYTPTWFLAEAGQATSLRPGDARQWDLAQGSFIRTLIRGPLHWLGLADLVVEEDELTAVRFHGLADLYWDRLETPPAPPHATREAQVAPPADAVQIAHHTITLHPAAVRAQAHNLMDRIARLERATAERFVYQLDAQAAYEAFEDGVTLSKILEEWQTLMPVPLPEPIRAQLAAWWGAYGRVRVYQDLTVIEFGDDYALAEMKAVTSLERHLVAEISPRLVIVAPAAVATLVAELEKAGYTPKLAGKRRDD